MNSSEQYGGVRVSEHISDKDINKLCDMVSIFSNLIDYSIKKSNNIEEESGYTIESEHSSQSAGAKAQLYKGADEMRQERKKVLKKGSGNRDIMPSPEEILNYLKTSDMVNFKNRISKILKSPTFAFKKNSYSFQGKSNTLNKLISEADVDIGILNLKSGSIKIIENKKNVKRYKFDDRIENLIAFLINNFNEEKSILLNKSADLSILKKKYKLPTDTTCGFVKFGKDFAVTSKHILGILKVQQTKLNNQDVNIIKFVLTYNVHTLLSLKKYHQESLHRYKINSLEETSRVSNVIKRSIKRKHMTKSLSASARSSSKSHSKRSNSLPSLPEALPALPPKKSKFAVKKISKSNTETQTNNNNSENSNNVSSNSIKNPETYANLRFSEKSSSSASSTSLKPIQNLNHDVQYASINVSKLRDEFNNSNLSAFFIKNTGGKITKFDKVGTFVLKSTNFKNIFNIELKTSRSGDTLKKKVFGGNIDRDVLNLIKESTQAYNVNPVFKYKNGLLPLYITDTEIHAKKDGKSKRMNAVAGRKIKSVKKKKKTTKQKTHSKKKITTK